jgi:hypothetical protein
LASGDKIQDSIYRQYACISVRVRGDILMGKEVLRRGMWSVRVRMVEKEVVSSMDVGVAGIVLMRFAPLMLERYLVARYSEAE